MHPPHRAFPVRRLICCGSAHSNSWADAVHPRDGEEAVLLRLMRIALIGSGIGCAPFARVAVLLEAAPGRPALIGTVIARCPFAFVAGLLEASGGERFALVGA